jgi:hypothetical protein
MPPEALSFDQYHQQQQHQQHGSAMAGSLSAHGGDGGGRGSCSSGRPEISMHGARFVSHNQCC